MNDRDSLIILKGVKHEISVARVLDPSGVSRIPIMRVYRHQRRRSVWHAIKTDARLAWRECASERCSGETPVPRLNNQDAVKRIRQPEQAERDERSGHRRRDA